MNGAWVRADALQPDDILTVLAPGSGAGGLAAASGLLRTIQVAPAQAVVYDIEVDGVHNKPPKVIVDP